MWADGGYAGRLMAPAKRALGLGVEIVKRSQDTKGFQVLNRNGDDDTFTPQKEMGKHDPNVNHGTYVDDDGTPRISPDDDRPYLDPDNRPSFRQ